MARKKTQGRNEEPPRAAKANRAVDIFARRNRGLLFDVLIFLANISVMQLLVRLFLLIFREADAGDVFAKAELLFFYAGLLALPSFAAVLKRWHYHQRIKRLGEKEEEGGWLPFGCIFIPALYLMVSMCFTLAVALSFLNLFPDSDFGRVGSGILLTVCLVFNVVQTVLVFRYFAPPKHRPKSAFLRDPRSEALGDLCVFLNMLSCQVFLNWAAQTYPGFHEGRFVDRVIPLVVFVLFMYLMGRIFYLVEDIRHPRTLLTILLANSPVVIRAVLNVGPAR
jgi:hypothetical protein